MIKKSIQKYYMSRIRDKDLCALSKEKNLFVKVLPGGAHHCVSVLLVFDRDTKNKNICVLLKNL